MSKNNQPSNSFKLRESERRDLDAIAKKNGISKTQQLREWIRRDAADLEK